MSVARDEIPAVESIRAEADSQAARVHTVAHFRGALERDPIHVRMALQGWKWRVVGVFD